MSKVIRVMLVDGNDWKLPFNFALGLHVIFILATIYGPQFIQKPFKPDIYTIDLVNFQEPIIQPQPSSPPPQKKEPEPKVEKIADTAVPIPEKIEPPPAVKQKPISIKPLKRKKKHKLKVDQRKQLEQISKIREQQAREAERRAEEAARLAAQEAVDQLKSLLNEPTQATTPQRSAPRRSVTNRQPSSNAVMNQYGAHLYGKIAPYWTLPEYKIWDPSLTAILVLVVKKNGDIQNQFFEKKSGDDTFDQYVIKTVQSAVPLPPFPAALKKEKLEFVLEFTPGSVKY